MTYYELNTLVDTTIKNYYGTGTTVQYTEGDIYQLNDKPGNVYPAFNFFLNQMVQNSSDIVYQVTLFYVDMLNVGHSNTLLIKSDAIEVLKIIVANIDNAIVGDLLSGVTYTPFIEKFTDECAGAYVKFNLKFPYSTLCIE